MKQLTQELLEQLEGIEEEFAVAVEEPSVGGLLDALELCCGKVSKLFELSDGEHVVIHCIGSWKLQGWIEIGVYESSRAPVIYGIDCKGNSLSPKVSENIIRSFNFFEDSTDAQCPDMTEQRRMLELKTSKRNITDWKSQLRTLDKLEEGVIERIEQQLSAIRFKPEKEDRIATLRRHLGLFEQASQQMRTTLLDLDQRSDEGSADSDSRLVVTRSLGFKMDRRGSDAALMSKSTRKLALHLMARKVNRRSQA